MAVYTYDEEADALYVLLAPEAEIAISRTVELGERLHVDVDDHGHPVGVEILYPSRGPVDLGPIKDRFGLKVRLPFEFAA
ncbi:MAG: DUF2283 domain-containing protein [Actinomycetota bacterium]